MAEIYYEQAVLGFLDRLTDKKARITEQVKDQAWRISIDVPDKIKGDRVEVKMGSSGRGGNRDGGDLDSFTSILICVMDAGKPVYTYRISFERHWGIME